MQQNHIVKTKTPPFYHQVLLKAQQDLEILETLHDRVYVTEKFKSQHPYQTPLTPYQACLDSQV